MMANDGSMQHGRLSAALGRAAYRLPIVPRPRPMVTDQAERHQEAGRSLLAEDPHVVELAGKLCETLSAVTVSDETDLVGNLLVHLAGWIGSLPASEASHHSGVFGLLQHSVEVATLAATHLEVHHEAFEAVTAAAPADRPQWARAAIIAALLHDVGKIYDVRYSHQMSGETWNPDREPLSEFVLRIDKESDRRTRVSHVEGRGRRHEVRGRLLIARVLPASIPNELLVRAVAVFDAHAERHDLGDIETVWPLPFLATILVAADGTSSATPLIEPIDPPDEEGSDDFRPDDN